MGLFGPSWRAVDCFGKLRIYADFIQSAHRTGFRPKLQEWLASGASSLADVAGVFRSWSFAWPLDGERDVMVGRVWSSLDAVGRTYPFAVWTQAPQRELGIEEASELPLACEPFWSDLDGLTRVTGERRWSDLGEGELPPTAIQKAVKDARLRARPSAGRMERLLESLRAWKAAELLEKLMTESYVVVFPRVLWSLVDVGRALRGGSGVVAAVRLPASSAVPVVFQAAFWVRCIEAQAGARLPRPPCLFVPEAAHEEAGLWILFREPIGLDVPCLFSEAEPHGYLTDLRRPDGPGPDRDPRGEFEAFRARVQEFLAGPRTALDVATTNFSTLRG